jgi:hypothetical protein
MMAPFQSAKPTNAAFAAFATKIGGVQMSLPTAAGAATVATPKTGGGGGRIGWDLLGVLAAILAIRFQSVSYKSARDTGRIVPVTITC